MDFWDVAQDMRPKMESWARVKYGSTHEEAEDLVSRAIIKAAGYHNRNPSGILMRTLATVRVDEIRRLESRVKWETRFQTKNVQFNYGLIQNHASKKNGKGDSQGTENDFGQFGFCHDTYCFILHDLRTSNVPVIAVRTCELIMVGCDVPEVRAVLDLTPVMFRDIQRQVAPCLSQFVL